METTNHVTTTHQSERGSLLDNLISMEADPNAISLAGGLPDPRLFPLDMLQDAFDATMRSNSQSAFQYGPAAGLMELREHVAQMTTTPRLRVNPANILITGGSQQALHLVAQCLVDETTTALTENPSYVGMLMAWNGRHPKWTTVRTGDASALKSPRTTTLPYDNRVLYLNPNFRNPTGETMIESARRSFARLAYETGTYVIEDDAYGRLRYDGADIPNILGMEDVDPEGTVIRLETTSKFLMPSLRVGWTIASRQMTERLTRARQTVDLQGSHLTQRLVLEMLRNPRLDDHLTRIRATYARKRDALIESLDVRLNGKMTWDRPEGGLFVMARIREGGDASKLLRHAFRNGVTFLPGSEFHLAEEGKECLRLSFGSIALDQIDEGVRRLSKSLDDMEDDLSAQRRRETRGGHRS